VPPRGSSEAYRLKRPKERGHLECSYRREAERRRPHGVLLFGYGAAAFSCWLVLFFTRGWRDRWKGAVFFCGSWRGSTCGTLLCCFCIIDHRSIDSFMTRCEMRRCTNAGLGCWLENDCFAKQILSEVAAMALLSRLLSLLYRGWMLYRKRR